MVNPTPAHASPSITLAIPTFNRAETVRRVLFDVCAHEAAAADYLSILVADDGSSDETSRRLDSFNALHDRFRLLRNETNLGFQGNFINLINSARSDFIVVVSDDDRVVMDHLEPLHALLKRHPDTALVSTQWRTGNDLTRGAAEEGPLNINDFRRCCAHLPGTVFKVGLAQAVINDPRIQPILLDPRNFYPQCMLAFLLMLSGHPALYLPFELCRLGYDLPSGIARYATVAGRWNEFQVFDAFFQAVLKMDLDPLRRQIVETFLNYHHKNLFPLLVWGMSEESPEHLDHLLSGALTYAEQPEGNRKVGVWL